MMYLCSGTFTRQRTTDCQIKRYEIFYP